MKTVAGAALVQSKRRATRDHYDRYPYGFDQEEILKEKLDHRVMGEAIRALGDGRGQLVVDVGCGACRVAQLVRRTSSARMVSLDLSRASLRSARARNPDPLVNADNLQLPLATGCADLVISNGVIHHTPDARASFEELARVTRPGGTLVVSVYNRHSWYYPLFTLGSPVVRGLQRLLGDRGLKLTLFPFFHAGLSVLLSVATRRLFRLPLDKSWNLFHDAFTTPQCTFHTFAELEGWASEAGLACEERRREAADQLATLRLRKRASGLPA